MPAKSSRLSRPWKIRRFRKTLERALRLSIASGVAHRHRIHLRREASRSFDGERSAAMTRHATRLTAALLCAGGALISGFAASQTANGPASPAPDLNGFWTHGFSLGFDPPPEEGPGPVP